MNPAAAEAFLRVLVAAHSDLASHPHLVDSRAFLYVRPVEIVAVVRHENVRLEFFDVRKKLGKHGCLVWLIEHLERPRVFRLRSVLEVLDVFNDDRAVDNEVALSVEHVRDHRDRILVRVWELQLGLGRFDIVRKHARARSRYQVLAVR